MFTQNIQYIQPTSYLYSDYASSTIAAHASTRLFQC